MGSHLLNLLLADARYAQVVSLVRKGSGIQHAKLQEQICDFSNLTSYENLFSQVDDLFICIGTTKQKTPDQNAYYAIDYGIPTLSASIAKHMGVKTIAVVSAMGANANSRIFNN